MTVLEIGLACGCLFFCMLTVIVMCVAVPRGTIAERDKKYAQLKEEHDRWKMACENSRKEHDACVRELATANAHWKHVLALHKSAWNMKANRIASDVGSILRLVSDEPKVPTG